MATDACNVKGTRDFFSVELSRRKYIIDTIKNCFDVYGFAEIETPAVENTKTLLGKYGEEGDRLIFKILNSGDFIAKSDFDSFEQKESAVFSKSISNKALRYDLTIPFARFVAQHRNELTFPFKRYQIQPVWRADRPQKGRYREFHQCDADIVGSNSIWQEIDLINLYDDVFDKLGLEVNIHLNNRKLLTAIADVLNISEKLTDFTVALDKLDKIGAEKVKEEMLNREISKESILKIEFLLNAELDDDKKLSELQKLIKGNELGEKGLEEINFIFSNINKFGLKKAKLIMDLSLARGLNYYTGSIFEVKAKNSKLGSIGAGGRYDDLTSLFGFPDLPGIGISFGLDRIFLAMEEANLFGDVVNDNANFLVINFGDKELAAIYPSIKKLRDMGKKVEIYPDTVKIKKQIQYAVKKNIENIIVCGEKEITKEIIVVRNLNTKEEKEVMLNEFETI